MECPKKVIQLGGLIVKLVNNSRRKHKGTSVIVLLGGVLCPDIVIVIYRACKIWYSIDETSRQCANVAIFKNKLKSKLVESFTST